tara:strand:- start:1333 stop:1602 length:270 start_codon:yes stop_codon:yes gene_type:complete
MSALQFPASPSSGDQFTASNGIQYTYDGEKWKTLGTSQASTDRLFVETPVTLTTNKTFSANTNNGAMSPMAIGAGYVVEIPSTSTLRMI